MTFLGTERSVQRRGEPRLWHPDPNPGQPSQGSTEWGRSEICGAIESRDRDPQDVPVRLGGPADDRRHQEEGFESLRHLREGGPGEGGVALQTGNRWDLNARLMVAEATINFRLYFLPSPRTNF